MTRPKLAWGSKVSPEFCTRVLRIGEKFDWNFDQASFLMSAIAFETGESFSPSVKNGAGSGATGLIQFMPSTATGMGTTTAKLAAMSAVEQLEYVERYFKPYASRVKTLEDMYMAILMPSFIGKPNEAVLFVSPKVSYQQNRGLDLNKDGLITKFEAASMVRAKYEKGMREGLVRNY